ncbi:MAG: hypothetical protein NTZ20_04850 [Candidatus Levybacteria bacterium]|nr:hypothetical protein [Candidatus Levybacteria bacterium]
MRSKDGEQINLDGNDLEEYDRKKSRNFLQNNPLDGRIAIAEKMVAERARDKTYIPTTVSYNNSHLRTGSLISTSSENIWNLYPFGKDTNIAMGLPYKVTWWQRFWFRFFFGAYFERL